MPPVVSLDEFEKWADSFRSIGHPIRLAILFLLLGDEILHGRKSPTLTEIRLVLGLPNTKRATGSLSYHLDELVKAKFVLRKPLQKEEGRSKVKTVYHLSEKGWQFLTDFNVVERIKESLEPEF